MEVVDKNKLETSILYLQRITEGKNPVNNLPAGDDEVLNNPNVIRCMFFVKEVLESVRENDGIIGYNVKKHQSNNMSPDVMKSFVYKANATISELVMQINEVLEQLGYRKIQSRQITGWLKENGFLEERVSKEINRKAVIPTEKGAHLGIRAEKKCNENGIEYMLVIYNEVAQEYIVTMLDVILSGKK